MTIARPDRAFFLIATASALAYVSLPHDGALYSRWYQLFPIAAVVATLVGVTLNQPRSRAPWYLVALSGLCAVAADAIYAVQFERRVSPQARNPRDTRRRRVSSRSGWRR